MKINGSTHYLWQAVEHEGEVMESLVTKRHDRKPVLKFLWKTMKRHGRAHIFVTDMLLSYGAAMKEIGNVDKQETGRWVNNRAKNSHAPFRRRERPYLAFDACELYRNSSPCTLYSTTISTRSATFKPDQTSSLTALAEWRGLCAAWKVEIAGN